MLLMISQFQESDLADMPKQRSNSVINRDNKRRGQQITGETAEVETNATVVDVVPKSDSAKYTIMSVLKSHFLFSQMHDYELDDVIDAMQQLYSQENDVLITEGEVGDKFYVLEEGACEITIGGKYIARVDAPSSFGDLALMYNCPRAATIRAITHCKRATHAARHSSV